MSDEPKLSDLLQSVNKAAKDTETAAQKLAATERAIDENIQKLDELRGARTEWQKALDDGKTALKNALAAVDQFSAAKFSAKAGAKEGA